MSNPPPTLPTVRPKWKRSFQSTDIQPSSLSPIESATNPNSNKRAICPTCNKNEARYTCPKCLAPYCSTTCYKVHDIPANANVTNPIEGGGRCTEAFYREKVKQISHLAVKDEKNVSQMRDILTRTFYNNDEDEEKEKEKEESRDENVALTDEELMELAECGLTLDDTSDGPNDGRTEEDLLRSLPLHLRLKFEEAVQRGDLSHLVQKWHPFWLPKYDHDGLEADIDDGQMPSTTLDDRILAIQPLPSRNESDMKMKPRVVELQYNICEVLYLTAWTLRLYNTGMVLQLDDSKNNAACIDMTSFLYTQSQVLSNDARYESIAEVLMECTGRTSQQSINQSGIGVMQDDSANSIDWKLLVNDVICICRHRRMVLKALLTTVDMIDDVRKKLKRNNNDGGSIGRKEFMLAQKKVEYYASWCHSYWDHSCTEVVHDVEEWLKDWVLRDEDREDVNNLLLLEKGQTTSKAPTSEISLTKKSNDDTNSLLVPRSTRKL